jgi:hypothetical protein
MFKYYIWYTDNISNRKICTEVEGTDSSARQFYFSRVVDNKDRQSPCDTGFLTFAAQSRSPAVQKRLENMETKASEDDECPSLISYSSSDDDSESEAM